VGCACALGSALVFREAFVWYPDWTGSALGTRVLFYAAMNVIHIFWVIPTDWYRQTRNKRFPPQKDRKKRHQDETGKWVRIGPVCSCTNIYTSRPLYSWSPRHRLLNKYTPTVYPRVEFEFKTKRMKLLKWSKITVYWSLKRSRIYLIEGALKIGIYKLVARFTIYNP
jgi:hypothetical protein